MGLLSTLLGLVESKEQEQSKEQREDLYLKYDSCTMSGKLNFQNIKDGKNYYKNLSYIDSDSPSRYKQSINIRPCKIGNKMRNEIIKLISENEIMFGFSKQKSFTQYTELEKDVRFFCIENIPHAIFIRIPNGNNFRVIEFITGLSYKEFKEFYNEFQNDGLKLPENIKDLKVAPVKLNYSCEPFIYFYK